MPPVSTPEQCLMSFLFIPVNGSLLAREVCRSSWEPVRAPCCLRPGLYAPAPGVCQLQQCVGMRVKEAFHPHVASASAQTTNHTTASRNGKCSGRSSISSDSPHTGSPDPSPSPSSQRLQPVAERTDDKSRSESGDIVNGPEPAFSRPVVKALRGSESRSGHRHNSQQGI